MTNFTFWQMISDCRKKEGKDDRVFLSNIKQALEKSGEWEIFQFQAYLNTYIEAANLPALWEAAVLINNGCTEEEFEYFREWLVSQGDQIYHEALRNPDNLLTHAAKPYLLKELSCLPAQVYKDVARLYDDTKYRNLVQERQRRITNDLYRPYNSNARLKIQHSPDELESIYPLLAGRCRELGNDPKQVCLWPRQIPTENWGLQM